MGLRVLGLRRHKGRSSHTTGRDRAVQRARWRTARHVARKIQRDMPLSIAVVRCRNMAGLQPDACGATPILRPAHVSHARLVLHT